MATYLITYSSVTMNVPTSVNTEPAILHTWLWSSKTRSKRWAWLMDNW